VFDSYFKPDVPYKKGNYNLRCPVDKSWETAPNKILIVIETVDSQDLKASALLSDRARQVVTNLLTYSLNCAKEKGLRRKDVAFAAVNFNNVKFMDKPKETWPSARAEFAKRVKAVIKDLEPTTILVFGDYATKALLPEEEFLPKKRGWVIDTEVLGHKVKIVPTLDLLPLYTQGKADIDQDEEEETGEGDVDVYAKANLLFYVTGHVTNALLGRMQYDLSKIKVRPRLIDTIEKFNSLYKHLKQEKHIAVDTETENLSVNHNKLKTIQFAYDDSGIGYMVPVDHEETPFSPKETRYIKKKLRRFFYAKPNELPCKYLIMVNGKFDTRILRKALGIPIIFHPIWEITAAEWLADENRTSLKDAPFGTPHGGLEQILFTYGNDAYKTAKFSKGDRSNSNLTKISNPEFVRYGCTDVVAPFMMHLMQLEKAADLKLGDKEYKPFFRRLVLNQMSNTVHSISHMESTGVAIDRNYLALLKSKASPLLKLISEFTKLLMATPELKQANKKLLEEGTGQKSNTGLFNTVLSVFNFGKSDHQQLLFFNILGLTPLGHTKEGKAKVDKAFIKGYSRDYPIVENFGKLVKLKKLWSTYVKGWWNKIQDSVDSRVDWMLRASYGFFDVVTGRLNSMKPSLQQVPQRGSESKYIKRAFRAPKGKLQVKFDYSAHEVRVWSMVSFDSVLASAFRVGQQLRKKLRRTTDPDEIKAIFEELKKKGDIHIQNVKRFFDMWVDKSHPLRDAIKQVVFGVIYCKSAKSLAKDIRATAKSNLDDKKYALRNELKAEPSPKKSRQVEIKEELLKLKPEYEALARDDKVKLSQSIMAKMFAEFPKGAEWLEWSKSHAEQNYYTYSPIGVRRNLFGIMTGIQGIVSAMKRRAANSPIQGLASQIGVTASRLVILEMWDVLMKFGYMDEDTEVMPCEISKQVHDAQYSDVPYNILLIFIHVMQWTVTYGVTKHFKDVYDFEFTTEPEIELEIGITEDKHYTWDWTDKGLRDIITKSLDDQMALKDLDAEERKSAESTIWSVYENKKLKKYLNTKYPILGVIPKEYQ
jgi:DNA polymerase I-like protein with 3'-5' exonuclease and polymerase domains